MTQTTRLDLPLLLPELPDERDACVARLEDLLSERPGIHRAHVVAHARQDGTSALCIHYDPDLLSLTRVEALARLAGVEVTARYGHVVLPVRAVGSEDLGQRIEEALTRLPGVLSASANMAAQRVRVEYERAAVTPDRLQAELDALGLPTAPPPPEADTCCRPPEPVPDRAGWFPRNRELTLALGAGGFLVAGWAGARWLAWGPVPVIAAYLGAYALGSFDILRHTLGSLRRGRLTFGIDLLMILAATGAAALGDWAEGAFLLFLFSLAHALEHYALGRARRAIRALADLAPPVAHVLGESSVRDISVEDVRVGDTVLVRPAERIPVDGTVRTGRSAVNQAPITGESVPLEKAPGDQVFAGTVNGDGSLEVLARGVAGDRTLDRVIRLVEEAQTQKAPTQRLTERFERVFVPAVLALAVVVMTVPGFVGLWPWATGLYRGVALLVAAAPCALALGTPAAVLAGIAQAARHGVLIKGGAHLENLGTLRAMAFDKTGTLTEGRPEVTDVVPADGASTRTLLATAAAVERLSQHPLARAVVRRAEADGITLPASGDLQTITARGVRSSVDGDRVEVGRLRLWEDAGIPVPPEIRQTVQHLETAGRSIVAVRAGDRWLGVIGAADRPRLGVADVLAQLRGLGLGPLVMLTGDHRGVGNTIGREIGVDAVDAELLPEDKVRVVSTLLNRHGQVAMVGDGVNDAPALAHATVGIAMGGAGTAAALETADVALMGDDLGRLPFAVGLSRQARRIIRQNLAIAVGVLTLLVVAAATGVLGIGSTVVFHEGSTLIVIGNALRLLAFRGAEQAASGAGYG